MAAKRMRGRPKGSKTNPNNLRNRTHNQNYRLVRRTVGERTAYIIQRSPKNGVWFDFEGYDNELVARQRFTSIYDGGGIDDVVIDSKVKHTRAAKVLAQGSETEESET